MLSKMLAKQYNVIPASSGDEAISRAKQENPDLVLLDIEMPGLDGFQTFDILKKEVLPPAVPVIFLTAREDSQSREKGLEAGAVDYITKPYDSQELAIKVKNHLALYEARKEIEKRNRIMPERWRWRRNYKTLSCLTNFPGATESIFMLYISRFPRQGEISTTRWNCQTVTSDSPRWMCQDMEFLPQ